MTLVALSCYSWKLKKEKFANIFHKQIRSMIRHIYIFNLAQLAAEFKVNVSSLEAFGGDAWQKGAGGVRLTEPNQTINGQSRQYGM